jgi:hypothetical protein
MPYFQALGGKEDRATRCILLGQYWICDSAITTADAARTVGWPDWVSIVEGDGAELVGTIGSFDLIFPDAPGGKIFKLRKTISHASTGRVSPGR